MELNKAACEAAAGAFAERLTPGPSTSDLLAALRFALEAYESVRLAAAPASQQEAGVSAWINVDERLPERGQQVIAYRPTAAQTNDDPVRLVRYTGHERESWQGVMHGFDCICHPTHWMRLPPAPEQTSRAQRTNEET